MALIKLQGKTKIQGKTVFDGGPTPEEIATGIASNYIAAVESADGESLESGVAQAYTDFVVGCYTDGIWDSIKASCILAGARTLDGALVPLVGTAPTNNNFVSADYNRETGLKGNGSTKYLDSNRADNADGQNDHHMSVYMTNDFNYYTGMPIGVYDASSTTTYTAIVVASGRTVTYRSRETSWPSFGGTGIHPNYGFLGLKRNAQAYAESRTNGTASSTARGSVAASSNDVFVFARSNNGSPQSYSKGTLTFYSIGSDIDLPKLDTRVSTLMTNLGNAIA